MSGIKGLIARFRTMWRSVGHDRRSGGLQAAIPSSPPGSAASTACHPDAERSEAEGSLSLALSADQFRELMIAALEDSPRARAIVRQAFLPASPIQGATDRAVSATNATVGRLPYFDSNSDGTTYVKDSNVSYDSTNSRIGIGTTTPSHLLAVGSGTSDSVSSQAKIIAQDGTAARLGAVVNNKFAYLLSDGTVAALGGFDYGSWAALPVVISPDGGNVGIGTTSPAAKLDVAGGINASGSVVIGGTATKQSSGGPELLSFQNSDPDQVAFAGFEPSDTNFRFGASVRGFMEWGAGGSADQDVALFRTGLGGGLAVQSFNNKFSKHALSVQRPTASGAEVDFFRASTMENLVETLGSLAVTGTAFAAAGTVSATAGSSTVTGTGTLFNQQVSAGDKITVDVGGSAETRTVLSITDDTHLAVTSQFSSTHSNVSMTITKQELVQVKGSSGSVNLYMSDSGNVGIGTATPGSKLAVTGLPVYANNTAAKNGGLAAGDFYRTNGDPDLVCVVH